MSIITVQIPNSQTTWTADTDDYLFVDIPQGSGKMSIDTGFSILKIFIGNGKSYYITNTGVEYDFTYGGAALVQKISVYKKNGASFLFNGMDLVTAVTPYKSTDSNWKTFDNKKDSFFETHSYTVPNFQIDGKSIRGIAYKKQEATDEDAYVFNNNLTTPIDSSKTWKNFGFTSYGYYLAFNNFGATFKNGSLASKNLKVEITSSNVKLTWNNRSKSVSLPSGAEVILVVRHPVDLEYCGYYQWALSEYAGRMLSISWVPKDGTIPSTSDDRARHFYAIQDHEINFVKLNTGTYIFKGEDLSINGTNYDFNESWVSSNKIKTIPRDMQDWIQTVDYEEYDNSLYIPNDKSCNTANSGWMASSVYIQLCATWPFYEPDRGGPSYNYTPSHTRFVLLDGQKYFKSKNIDLTETLDPSNKCSYAFYENNNDHMIAAYYPRHRYLINSVGLVKTGFAAEPATFFQYPVIAPPKKTTKSSDKLDLTISTRGHTYSYLNYTYETSYFSLTEMWAKDKVKMGIQAGTFVNVSRTVGANGALTNVSGYTNEPAIAIVIKTSEEVTTDFSYFMLDEKE